MRKLTGNGSLIFLFCLASCSDNSKPPEAAAKPAANSLPPQQKPATLSNAFEAATRGEAFALSINSGTLKFCDTSGPHEADLRSAIVTAAKGSCPVKAEANSACSGIQGDPTVRSTPNQPNETIDAGGRSYPLQGRVQDCVADGSKLAIATNSTVLWLDSTEAGIHVIKESAGDRVAIGSGWLAWTTADRIFAKSIH